MLFVKDEIDKYYCNKKLNDELLSRECNEIEELRNKISILERENNYLKNIENNFVKRTILIMDELQKLKENLNKSQDEEVILNIEKRIKFIKKHLSALGFETISGLGGKFDEDYHDCIDIMKNNMKENGDIVEEGLLGYIYRGTVIRACEVLIVKNGKENELWEE